MQRTTAEMGFEVEVLISGVYNPGHPGSGPSYASGGDPPEPSGFEDIVVEKFWGLRRRYSTIDRNPYWETIDLFAGVDPATVPQRFLDNILSFIGQDEANTALFGELPEDD